MTLLTVEKPEEYTGMFKNYLTYNFALGFHRSCGALECSPTTKERLLRSSEIMIHHFSRAIRTNDLKEESKFLCVTLIALRDCKEILDENQVHSPELQTRYAILHPRIEDLVLKATQSEHGQLRMLG